MGDVDFIMALIVAAGTKTRNHSQNKCVPLSESKEQHKEVKTNNILNSMSGFNLFKSAYVPITLELE
jgi:hypothetical protein